MRSLVLCFVVVFLLLASTLGTGRAQTKGGGGDKCDDIRKALDAQEQPATRLKLATCEAREGKVLAALRDGQQAQTDAQQAHDADTAREARRLLASTLPRVAHVTFVAPAGVEGLAVTFDGKPVPPEKLGQPASVDPGHHVVHAEGVLAANPLTFDKEYDLDDGQSETVAILLVPQKPEYLTVGQLKCVLLARSQEEVSRCLPQNRTTLVVKAQLELSAYSDTNNVNVISPSVNGSVSSPTGGWNVGGSYTIDVVSAASPDIVSEASPPFHEVRHAGALTGGYKPGNYGVQATAHVSDEPDYFSVGGGVAFAADLNDKQTTPRIAYDYSHDTIGRSTTDFSVFHHDFQTHEVEAGVTWVLTARSLLLFGGSVQFERGDQSKVYRYVPMFDGATAPTIKPGESIDAINRARLQLRPLEQLPLERNRYAIGARFAHRFSSSTLRLEQRLYDDSWEQKATTTDVRWMFDIGRALRVWPHGRVNAQTGADFYKLAYTASFDPNAHQYVVPAFRTGDRELSPLVTVTGGAGVRVDFSSAESTSRYAATLQTDVMYSRYFDSMFITQRTAIYGTLGFEGEFQ